MAESSQERSRDDKTHVEGHGRAEHARFRHDVDDATAGGGQDREDRKLETLIALERRQRIRGESGCGTWPGTAGWPGGAV